MPTTTTKLLISSISLLAVGCTGATSEPDLASGNFMDLDQDGWSQDVDCDDENPTINPGATEVCMDGVDNDCDGWAGSCELEDRVDLGQANARMVGESAGDHASWSIAAVGDINGDGIGDLAVGSYAADDAGPLAGAVYLFHGPVSGNINLSFADAKLTGEASGGLAGWSVDGAGDINRDGYADIIVGAQGVEGEGVESGVAYIVFGPVEGEQSLAQADVRLEGEAAYDGAGSSVAGIGDINRDGYPDVAIGAPGSDEGGLDAGATYIFRGPLLGTRSMSSADAIIVGEQSEDFAGTVVDGADVNGDGYSDLLIAAPGSDKGGEDSGAAYLFKGPLSGVRSAALADATLVGEASGDEAGTALSFAGDVDGDEVGDLLIGAPGADRSGEDSGAIYLFSGDVSGQVSLADARATVFGAAGDEAGRAISAGGDVNQDGFADMIFGVAGDDEGGEDAGAAWLFHGPISGDLPCDAGDTWFVGEQPGDAAGSSVSMTGDVNGDGFADLLIGALGSDMGGADSGATYLVSGQGW